MQRYRAQTQHYTEHKCIIAERNYIYYLYRSTTFSYTEAA